MGTFRKIQNLSLALAVIPLLGLLLSGVGIEKSGAVAIQIGFLLVVALFLPAKYVRGICGKEFDRADFADIRLKHLRGRRLVFAGFVAAISFGAGLAILGGLLFFLGRFVWR